MIIKYDVQMDNESICTNLIRITNQIYKLLPNREEGLDWEKPLETIMEEIAGIKRLLPQYEVEIFQLMSKLEGLFTLTSEEYFFIFRKTIFESLNIIGELVKLCQD